MPIARTRFAFLVVVCLSARSTPCQVSLASTQNQTEEIIAANLAALEDDLKAIKSRIV
jgi:hypothetical protein